MKLLARLFRRGGALRPTLTIAALLGAFGAAANPMPPLAPTTTDGDYSVTPQGCNASSGTMYCAGLWLEERDEPGGSWHYADGEFSNKAPGSYSYRSVDYYCDAWYGWCITQYSAAITVVVTDADKPAAEPLEAQLSYRYRVRAGNVTGDSGIDLLVERISGPEAGNGAIDQALLENTGGGRFRLAAPASSLLASSLWQPTSVHVAVEDMNADGYADVALKNVAAAVAGAPDQIVYASGDAWYTQPTSLRALDAPLRQFTQNLTQYMSDNEYFSDNAPIRVDTVTYFYTYCPETYGYNDWSMEYMLQCTDFYFVDFLYRPDYSVFNADAVAIWQDELAVADGALSQSAAVERILDRIENVAGVGIGGWDLSEIFGTGPAIDDPVERRGLDGFLAIIGIGNASAQEASDDDALAGPRQTDRIYIAGRYLFGSSVNKMHTALLYHMPVTGVPTWYGAYDSDDRSLFDGRLIARTNDPRDTPLLMRMTLGEVSPPAAETNFSYFFVNMLSAHDHYRALPESGTAVYDAIPEIPCGGCNGRNSNGYVHGLIAATGGQPVPAAGINLNGLTGWEYPVEAYYFGR